MTKLTDQLGTVHQFDFDKLGQQTQDRVTTLGSGVDTAVKRIAMTYDVRGLVQNATSYDNATVGSGAIVNDVQRGYNTFGQLTTEYQSHSGAVNTMTTAKVQYAYANGSTNTSRPTSVTYPNGRVLTYDYGTGGGMADSLSRIASLIDNDGTTHLADYSYLGMGTFVETDLTQPDLLCTLVTTAGGNDPDTGDIYRGLDRFGRVKDLQWRDYGAGADAARIKHGYDRAGNRLYREDPVAASYGKAFDELYLYDGSYRLRDMKRGTLNAGKTAITAGTQTFGQCWTLDTTGNWRGFREDSNGDATWNLVQSRSANPVNEITGITNTTGSAWANPAYNAVGNMTTIPQPADPTKSYTAIYDAWNRLTKLVDGANTVQENAYDALRRRTVRKDYTAGILSETRHFYYTAAWQVVEERLGTTPDSANPNRQFVWGLRYIDDLLLRDRDTDGNGSLDERLYGMQDPNWNIIALGNTGGDVQERYAYSNYGTPGILADTFTNRASSAYSWETLWQGYRFDSPTALYLVRHRAIVAMIGTWIQRDPFGWDLARDPNRYTLLRNRPLDLVDPSGTTVTRAESPSTFTGGKTCIITMNTWFGMSPDDPDRWNGVAEDLQTLLGEDNAEVIRNITSTAALLAAIKNGKCCQVIMMGHRGGPRRPGGIVTGLGATVRQNNAGPITVLPNRDLEAQIAAAIQGNNCGNNCRIYIYSCGSADPNGRRKQQRLANSTGCMVCGTRRLIALLPGRDQNVTVPDHDGERVYPGDFDPRTDREEPGTECVLPNSPFEQHLEDYFERWSSDDPLRLIYDPL